MVPSGATMPGPNRSTTAGVGGPSRLDHLAAPPRRHRRSPRPARASSRDTVDLPEPIPPVRPTTSIRTRRYRGAAARAVYESRRLETVHTGQMPSGPPRPPGRRPARRARGRRRFGPLGGPGRRARADRRGRARARRPTRGGDGWSRISDATGASPWCPGPVESTAATALGGLALDPGPGARPRPGRCSPGLAGPPHRRPEPLVPHDPTTRGWGWTPDHLRLGGAHGLGRPRPPPAAARRAPAIADGLRVLADRECVGGGWNYGNRIVYGVALVPFVQTTATAVLALQGAEPDLVARGRRILLERAVADEPAWPLARARPRRAAAHRARRRRPRSRTRSRRASTPPPSSATSPRSAWAALATGPGLERLRLGLVSEPAEQAPEPSRSRARRRVRPHASTAARSCCARPRSALGVAAAGLVGANLLERPARPWDGPRSHRSAARGWRCCGPPLRRRPRGDRRRAACARSAPTCAARPSCSSRTSSSTTRRRPSTPTPASSPRPCSPCGGSGPASVTVGEGPGSPARHRVRRAAGRACSTRSAPSRPRSSTSTSRRSCAGRLRSRYTDPPRALAARVVVRQRRGRLDAEDEDAPLGRRDPVAQELLRVRARAGLRLAEERPALGGARGRASSTSPRPCAPTSRSSTASSAWRATGPSAASRKVAGLVVFGTDPVAADATAAYAMGIDPERVGYLREAGRFLGQVHLDELTQAGEDPDRARVPFRLLPAVRPPPRRQRGRCPTARAPGRDPAGEAQPGRSRRDRADAHPHRLATTSLGGEVGSP